MAVVRRDRSCDWCLEPHGIARLEAVLLRRRMTQCRQREQVVASGLKNVHASVMRLIETASAQGRHAPSRKKTSPAPSRHPTPSHLYPTPSCSAAIRVPATRFVIFWNATSRA